MTKRKARKAKAVKAWGLKRAGDGAIYPETRRTLAEAKAWKREIGGPFNHFCRVVRVTIREG